MSTHLTPTKKIYCFDTSAFVNLSKTSEDVIHIPNELWDYLEKMIKKGEVISHKIVFDELVTKSKKPEKVFISRWIRDKGKYFSNKTQFQIDTVSKIVSKFNGLIDPECEHEQADPWIIALAIQKVNDSPLFGIKNVSVVSQEGKFSDKKIPAVCASFGVEHLSLRGFFQEIGLGIKLIKK